MEIQLEDALLFPLMALEIMKPEMLSLPNPHLRESETSALTTLHSMSFTKSCGGPQTNMKTDCISAGEPFSEIRP